MNLPEYVHEFYHHRDNYKIIDNPQATEPDLCVVFFSSVGLYSEKNYATRLEADYYEFHRNPVRHAGRIIYVRDVTLTFYQNGINHQINSIDKILELIKDKSQGYRLVTIGISGGGYMAMLTGAVLGAEYVISESGCLNLDFMKGHFQKVIATGAWQPGRDDKYWNICQLLQTHPVTIYQFEAAHCVGDHENAALLASVSNARFFNIDSDMHGSVIDGAAAGAVVNLRPGQLEQLWKDTRGRIVSRLWFNFQVLSLWQLLKLYGKKLRKKILKIKFSDKEKLLVVCGLVLINTTNNKAQH